MKKRKKLHPKLAYLNLDFEEMMSGVELVAQPGEEGLADARDDGPDGDDHGALGVGETESVLEGDGEGHDEDGEEIDNEVGGDDDGEAFAGVGAVGGRRGAAGRRVFDDDGLGRGLGHEDEG